MKGQIDASGYVTLYLENMAIHLAVEVFPFSKFRSVAVPGGLQKHSVESL
jgi:hypothetical protein